jgi:hypothetical protein
VASELFIDFRSSLQQLIDVVYVKIHLYYRTDRRS